MSIQPHMSNSSKDEGSTGDFFFFYVFAVCMSMTLTVWLTVSKKSQWVTELLSFFLLNLSHCAWERMCSYTCGDCTYVFMHVSMYVSIYVSIYLCMYVCMYVCVYMYVCTCIYVHIGLGEG